MFSKCNTNSAARVAIARRSRYGRQHTQQSINRQPNSKRAACSGRAGNSVQCVARVIPRGQAPANDSPHVVLTKMAICDDVTSVAVNSPYRERTNNQLEKQQPQPLMK